MDEQQNFSSVSRMQKSGIFCMGAAVIWRFIEFLKLHLKRLKFFHFESGKKDYLGFLHSALNREIHG